MAKGKRREKQKLIPIREPSGRLSRAADQTMDAVAPTAAKRLRDAAARGMADAEWGTEIGRLFLAGKLTGLEYAAGKRWDRLVARWHRVVGAQPPYPCMGPVAFLGTPRSRDGGEDPPADSVEGRAMIHKRRETMREMQEAHAVLIGAGMLAESAVRATCEANEVSAEIYGVDNLKRGLAWLAKYWGLTRG